MSIFKRGREKMKETPPYKLEPKPCDTCCTNKEHAINRGEITCFEDCYAFEEWQKGVIKET